MSRLQTWVLLTTYKCNFAIKNVKDPNFCDLEDVKIKLRIFVIFLILFNAPEIIKLTRGAQSNKNVLIRSDLVF